MNTNTYEHIHPKQLEHLDHPRSSMIGIIESDASIAEVLAFQIRSLGYHLAWTVENHQQAIKQLQELPPDLVLLNLDRESGKDSIAIAQYIREHARSGIIFLSDGYHRDHVQLAKPIRPEAFLLKPVSTELLVLNIEMAMANRGRDEMGNNKLMVKVGYKKMLIMLNELEYITSEDNYVCFHLPNNKRVMARSTINELLNRLDPRLFVRINRGTIISIRQVSTIDKAMVHIGKQSFPVSKTYRGQLLEALNALSRRV